MCDFEECSNLETVRREHSFPQADCYQLDGTVKNTFVTFSKVAFTIDKKKLLASQHWSLHFEHYRCLDKLDTLS